MSNALVGGEPVKNQPRLFGNDVPEAGAASGSAGSFGAPPAGQALRLVSSPAKVMSGEELAAQKEQYETKCTEYISSLGAADKPKTLVGQCKVLEKKDGVIDTDKYKALNMTVQFANAQSTLDKLIALKETIKNRWNILNIESCTNDTKCIFDEVQKRIAEFTSFQNDLKDASSIATKSAKKIACHARYLTEKRIARFQNGGFNKIWVDFILDAFVDFQKSGIRNPDPVANELGNEPNIVTQFNAVLIEMFHWGVAVYI